MSAVESEASLLELACPTDYRDYERVVLGHGSGGRLSRELVEQLLLPALGLPAAGLEDQAELLPITGRPVLTTDSFVVRPLFFPGGDIGRLAVFGTVNDLAVGGALPRELALSLILEEGLPIATLLRVARSIAAACAEARVRIVTGDTKVVERGKADGMYVTTSGIGVLRPGLSLSATRAAPGDVLLLSGPLGDHGIAVMVEREGIEVDGELASDCAPLTSLAQTMLELEPRIRCMRDPTRGGLASSLNEIAAASRVSLGIDESAIPVRDAVRGVCELLGLDPLYVACEGRLLAVVPPESADALLGAMRAHPSGRDAARIGTVTSGPPGLVTERTCVGGERVVLMLAGEQLPRIC